MLDILYSKKNMSIHITSSSSIEQCSKSLYSIESWLVKNVIPRSWMIKQKHIKGSIISELIIKQSSF